ncbi:hypothetical protein [Mesoflavibacter sp. CH_XMU1422-2]|uniref:hypothetical protein n=1 Tax=Mesoflavibacter sp. CH_XMU1422-2 TaxID=3107770 RepID=UPI00300A430C
MNNCTTKLIYLLFFFLNYSYAQTISGTVSDSKGNPIKANILIKDPNKKEDVSEFVIAQKGIFNYKLKKKYSTNGLLLEVTAIGYKKYEKLIKAIELKKNINFDIILLKEEVEKLEEVFLESRKRPFSIKNDTVVYNVESYKDGTERKVEDLLKKLPGIEISDDNNIIKYRGKSIETVTIEGDNLFDYNYSIGTKNINIDLVKEIEAIENYSENKLLKGIENSDKVILNLKIKENKTDLSVTTDIGFGDFPDVNKTPINLSSNLLAINKKHKSFLITTYNNVGENSSPFNYSGNQFNLEQLKENQYLAKQIIPELYLPLVTKNNLSNINNQFFGNLNSIFTFSEKIKTKINLYFISDRIRSDQLSESNIRINNQEFNTFDNNLIEKKPIQYRGDIELKFNTSETSLLEYNLSLRDESIDTNASILSNQENDFRSYLESTNTFLKQNLDYTKKISKKEALQIKITNTTNILGQNFNIQPSTLNDLDFGYDVQNNNNKKQNTSLKALFLGKGIKNNKYSIDFGFKLNNESFNSNLFSQNNTQIVTIEDSTNNLDYKKNVFYTNGSYNWRLGKFTITPNYSLKYIDQILEQEFSSSKSHNLVFEPSITIAYKVDRTSYFNLTSGLNRNTSSLQYFFTNQILIDNRLVKKNIPNISLQKNKTINLFFSKNDLFNQLELYLGASYTKQKGNIFNNVSITENTTEIENFFLPENTENIAINLNFSKLITFLKTNVKLSSNYSIFNSKNIVNNSGLRNNKSVFSSNSFFLKTAFNLPINLENKTTYILQENKNTSTFLNKSIENNLKLIFKPYKEISGTISYDYFVPSLKNKINNFSFLNSEIIFKPKNKNWMLNISGINLLNQNYFIQENTTDISNNSFRINLLKRYFLVNFTYSF